MLITDEILSQVLVQKGLLDEKNAKNLMLNAKSQKISFEDLIFEREIVPDEKLGAIISELQEVPFVRLADKTIPEELLHMVPFTLASSQYILPFEQNGNQLKVAFNQPNNYELITFLEKKTGLVVEPYYSTRKDIKSSLKVYNSDVNAKFTKLLKGALKDPTKIESLKDAAKILDTIILFAYQNGASDVHIEPHKDFLAIRYRVDGLLQTIAELPMKIIELITTRIKVLSNLRTDEHRTAQDGRFKIELDNTEITMRVSIVPTYDGEKTVLRLLSSSSQELNIDFLGYSKRNLDLIHNNIKKTHGMILVTGPTGSGKTTSMYSILKLINSPEINISTIEDPIEYQLEGINQIQVNPKAELTFATGLRSLLRQDPDVVMVGEIRDEETAGIAINAALTGHLVFATLHTNDVASTLPRLIDMGVEPFLVSATVKLILAQRLVRTICPDCRKPYELTPEQINSVGQKFNLGPDFANIFKLDAGKTTVTFYKGEGCEKCSSSGFKGRTSIAEAMEISDPVKKLIFESASPNDIEEQAKKEGMVSLFTDGIQKILAGITTIEEVLRVMHS